MAVISRFTRHAKKEEEAQQSADHEHNVKNSKATWCRSCVIILLALLVLDITTAGLFIIYEYVTDLELDESDYEAGPASTPYEGEPVVVWWTPFTGEGGISKHCGVHSCFFTQNRKYQSHSDLKALLFYGSNFNWLDVPLPRPPGVVWSLLHEESPKNMPVLAHEQVLRHFNFTSTFSRHSHLPLTLNALESLQVLKDGRFFVPTANRSSLRSSLAPVVYVQSICDSPTQRDEFVTELMKFIEVDSYGACLHNKDLPDSISDPMDGMHAEEFYEILAKYKFVLALENGVCEDYITEKLWRPLRIGVVPVYYGSPSVKDWLPNEKSAILVSDFASPKELAEYLHELDANDTAYEEHLQHKLGSNLITNSRLTRAMEEREWGTTDEDRNFIEAFECFVCERVSENADREEKVTSTARANHYQCPLPPSVLTQRVDPDNWWVDAWQSSRIEAYTLAEFLEENQNYTSHRYKERLRKRFNSTPGWRKMQ